MEPRSRTYAGREHGSRLADRYMPKCRPDATAPVRITRNGYSGDVFVLGINGHKGASEIVKRAGRDLKIALEDETTVELPIASAAVVWRARNNEGFGADAFCAECGVPVIDGAETCATCAEVAA